MAEPMYRRIADELRSQIESGKLPPGAQLPTEIDLREEYGASRNTIRDAIKWLIARGLIETRPGQGTFVIEKVSPFVTTLTADTTTGHGGDESLIYIAEVEASHRVPEISEPRVEIQKADRTVARALRIEEGALVVSRHQSRLIDGIPWSLQTSFYPMSLVQSGPGTRLLEATDIPEGAISYLADKCGIKQVGYRDTIAARPPDDHEVRFFRLPADSRVPVFEVRRLGFGQGHSRIRLTVTVYPSDRNRLRLDVGSVPPPSEVQPGATGQPDLHEFD